MAKNIRSSIFCSHSLCRLAQPSSISRCCRHSQPPHTRASSKAMPGPVSGFTDTSLSVSEQTRQLYPIFSGIDGSVHSVFCSYLKLKSLPFSQHNYTIDISSTAESNQQRINLSLAQHDQYGLTLVNLRWNKGYVAPHLNISVRYLKQPRPVDMGMPTAHIIC